MGEVEKMTLAEFEPSIYDAASQHVTVYYRQHCAKRNAPVFNLLKGRF